MNYANATVAQSPKQDTPVAPQMVEQLEKNLSILWNNIDMIQNRCHRILNLNKPTPEEKAEVPMENDFVQQMGNRLNSFAKANQRLEEIVNHLDKIV